MRGETANVPRGHKPAFEKREVRTDLGSGGREARPQLRRPRGDPALDLAAEQRGDYSLETSLQACEIRTLFFIISFKTC